MMAEPEWLAAEPTDRAKLTAIMAALRRCYAECGGHGQAGDSPHITTAMAEMFIGQMMITAEARITSAVVETAAAGDFGDAIRSATDDVMARRLAEVEAAVRADERARIRAMAVSRNAKIGAWCDMHGKTHYRESFADLIAEGK